MSGRNLIRKMFGAMCVATALSCLSLTAEAKLETTIFHGTVSVAGSHTALDLDPSLVLYAINHAGDAGVDRVVDGVTFTSSRDGIAGYSDDETQNLNNWDAADNTSTGPDAAEFLEILADIKCCGGPNTYNFDVANGTYKLQLFWSQNAGESRKWDLEVEGVLSVDEVYSSGVRSNGIPVGSEAEYTIFEQIVDVTDGTLNVRMGSIFQDGAEEAGDRNYVLSGAVVSTLIPEPSTLILAVMGLLGLGCGCRRRRRNR